MLLFDTHHRKDRIAIAWQTPRRRQNCYCLTDTAEKKQLQLLDRHHREDRIAIAEQTTEKNRVLLLDRHHREEANVIA